MRSSHGDLEVISHMPGRNKTRESAGQRGTAHVLVKMGRGKARDSACVGRNGARENAGQRGTVHVLMKMGRGKARDSAGQPAGQRGTAHVPIKMGRGNITPFGVLKI